MMKLYLEQPRLHRVCLQITLFKRSLNIVSPDKVSWVPDSVGRYLLQAAPPGPVGWQPVPSAPAGRAAAGHPGCHGLSQGQDTQVGTRPRIQGESSIVVIGIPDIS